MVCIKYCFWYVLNPVNKVEVGLVKQKFISAGPLPLAIVVVVLVEVKVLVVLSYLFWSPFFCTGTTSLLPDRKMQPLPAITISVCRPTFPVMIPVVDDTLHCPLILIAMRKIILNINSPIFYQEA